MKKETIFEFHITPLNEGQDINYREYFRGNFTELTQRCGQIMTGLQKLLKDGSFSVKVEDIQCTREFTFSHFEWYDEDNNVINIHTQKFQSTELAAKLKKMPFNYISLIKT